MTASEKIRPMLTHAGIWVRDIEAMQAFYSRVLGLEVSDEGFVPRYNGRICFLSNDPGIHHQMVLAEGCENILPRNHGNAWSVYFDDPEGNNIETYLDSPFHVPQPFGELLDFTLSNDEIVALTEKMCRDTEGFAPRPDWTAGRAAWM